MVYIDGVKYACERCIRGHRVTTCKHTDQPLTVIKPKGRPATQCAHCREQRKMKSLHARCICGGGSNGSHKHSHTCPCAVNPDLCTCAKNKYASSSHLSGSGSGSRRRTASNPPPARKRAASLLTSIDPFPSSQSPVSAGGGPMRSISSTGLVDLGRAEKASRADHEQPQQLQSQYDLLFEPQLLLQQQHQQPHIHQQSLQDPACEQFAFSYGKSNNDKSQTVVYGYNNAFHNQPYLSDFASGASSIDSDHETTGPVVSNGSTASSANVSVSPGEEYLKPIYCSDTVITSLFDASTSLVADFTAIAGETPGLYNAVEGDDFLSLLASSSKVGEMPLGQELWTSFESR